MTDLFFYMQKDKLLSMLQAELEISCTNCIKSEVQFVVSILQDYTFDNRLTMKGTLSRVIIDSLDYKCPLWDDVFFFDAAL